MAEELSMPTPPSSSREYRGSYALKIRRLVRMVVNAQI
jgi:hypothetical protein